MHIGEIAAALVSRDMATIKEAFLALANYPKHEQVTGLRAGNAMAFLEAAAEALRVDLSPMPHDASEALGLADGGCYAEAAAIVLRDRQTCADHFSMIFRAQ